MKRQNLMAINAASQYIRTIINVGLGFYSTRLILEALGDNRFGIYSLVAGIVFLLSFVVNAMSTTTQRFLSYHRGISNINELREVFGNSIFLHLILSGFLIILLQITGLFLFDGFLNIQSDYLISARYTYQCVIFMVICTCLTSPFRGMLVSHENLVYISVVDIIDGILKVIIAIVILNWDFFNDQLIEYSVLLTAISIFNLAACSLFCFYKYPECKLPKSKDWNTHLIKRMTGFTSWVIYSTLMIVGRNQGTAITLNKFFGTVINASFGIAVQINSACIFISGSILNAFNPYIIKSEGEGKRDNAIKYAKTASKLCYLMMLMAVIPLCFYMEQILSIWLNKIPPYAVLFSRIIILATLCDQITTGLSVINKAVGKLKIYALTVDTAKILTVPLLALLLGIGIDLRCAMYSYILMELLSSVLRLPVLKRQADISQTTWVKEVIMALIIPSLIITIYYYICSNVVSPTIINIILVSIFGCLLLVFVSYICALNTAEKNIVRGLLISFTSKLHTTK